MERAGKPDARVVAAFGVLEEDQLVMVSNGGQIIRVPVDGISIYSRSSRGVRVFNTAEDEHVVSVSRLRDVQDDGEDDDDLEDGEGETAEASDATPEEASADTPDAGKGPLFTLEERVAMLEAEIAALDPGIAARVEVKPFDNLLMEFVGQVGASLIVRGLRAVSDFEYEFQMAGMNARLNPKVETVFLMASERHQFISSRFVKEIGSLGGDVGHFVSPAVKEQLTARFAERKNAAD